MPCQCFKLTGGSQWCKFSFCDLYSLCRRLKLKLSVWSIIILVSHHIEHVGGIAGDIPVLEPKVSELVYKLWYSLYTLESFVDGPEHPVGVGLFRYHHS